MKSAGLQNIPLLFENGDCLVFDKPAGLPVQGGSGIRVSLDSLLAAAFPERPLLVHRLDRDTSGVIIVAKRREAAARLSRLLERGAGTAGGAVKRYLAVCAGAPVPPRGVISAGLEERGAVKRAETSYRVLSTKRLAVDDAAGASALTAALLELELGTGRTHQIRRHLAGAGCPVLGDGKYGDFALNRALRKALGLRRLLLHAHRLILPPSPLFPSGLDITAPLPAPFTPFADWEGGEKWKIENGK
jgi:23S rRNA pseudouridine955/2504/2580 synthase